MEARAVQEPRQDFREQAAESHAEQAPARAELAKRISPELPDCFFEHDEQDRVVVSTIDDSRRVVQGLVMCLQIETGEVVALPIELYTAITLFLAEVTRDEYTRRPTRVKATDLLIRMDASLNSAERVTARGAA